VTIGGHLLGTAAGDAYQLAAQALSSLVVAGTPVCPLAAGPENDLISGVGAYGDVTLAGAGPG
jgi:hypothetical protein